MIFYGELFTLENVSNDATRAALRTAVEQAGERIEASDLAAAAFLEADTPLWEMLAPATCGPAAVNSIMSAAIASLKRTASASGQATYARRSFSATALKALEAFEAIEREQAQYTRAAGLEAFLLCVLTYMDPKEREIWPELDVEAAKAILRSYLLGQESAEPDNGHGGRNHLAGELAAAESLSCRARELSDDRLSPFDGDPVYHQLFDELARVLHRSEGHALLVGERGVSQPALLLELARRAAEGGMPTLADKHVLLVDCRHTAPEQSRQRLVSLLRDMASHGELIVCVDGFASLLHSERGTTNKAALLASLREVRAKLVGLLTPREYEELLADDADVREQFGAVEVPEPANETAIRLVSCYAAGLEETYLVQIDREAIQQAVSLTADYILNERLPGKAVKVLREVCERIAYERAQYGRDRCSVTGDDIVEAVSQYSGVPEETLRGVADQCDYEESLAEEILGQEHAVREVAEELGLIKAGLIDVGKPASVMLFVGQTGTGKTEMAKALAQFYSRSKRLRTYTLGNFVEPHSVASIIGVPPGYVGHEQGGRIVTDLTSDPYCVFLLDEADKAHPDVLQPFLNLFDEGWVCDQRGVKAFADKAIFILTTNVGQRMLGDMARQGKTPEEMTSRMKEALAQIRHGKSNRPVFAPEFLARIKRVVVFQPLGHEAMRGICQKLLRRMQASWRSKRQKTLVVPDVLLEYIAAESHQRNEKAQGREGGRLVRKLIAERIESPIQRAATAAPDAYRECEAVVLKAQLPEVEEGDEFAVPDVKVCFRRASDNLNVAEPGEVEHVAPSV